MKLDCMIVDDEDVSRKIVKQFVEKTSFLNLIHECENGKEAADILASNGSVDILFLDIRMPEMSGIDLIKSLDGMYEVILITSDRSYAIEGYDLSVTDYLIKPIDYERFLQAANKAKANLELYKSTADEQKDIYVKTDAKIVKINLDEILFIEALADYIIIKTADTRYIVHSTMKGIESRLPKKSFIRVHRSYIVNLDKIESLQDMTIVIGEKFIPIGASYKTNLFDRLNFL